VTELSRPVLAGRRGAPVCPGPDRRPQPAAAGDRWGGDRGAGASGRSFP